MKLYVYKNHYRGCIELFEKETSDKTGALPESRLFLGTITLDPPEKAPKPEPKREPIVRYTAVFDNYECSGYKDVAAAINNNREYRYIVKHIYYPDDPLKNSLEVVAYE